MILNNFINHHTRQIVDGHRFARIPRHPMVHGSVDVVLQWAINTPIQRLQLVGAVRRERQEHHTVVFAVVDSFHRQVGDMVIQQEEDF